MDQRKEDVTRRPLYVYDLPKDILSTLTPKDDTNEGPDQEGLATQETEKTSKPESDHAAVAGSKACSLCGVTFHTVEDQRSHIRSDLHGYNLKQRIRGSVAVSEGDFEKLVGDLNESLSGSDSSDSEDDENEEAKKETTLIALLKKQATISSDNNGEADEFAPTKRKHGSGKAPMYWFTTATLPRNIYLGIYRAIFTNTEQQNEALILDVIQKKQLPPKPQTKIVADANNGVPSPEAYKDPHIFLCMIGGGHFAAMTVSLPPKLTKSSAPGPLAREATVLAHKTFHRYTTRRKQGGAQSSNDSAKGAAHSAGAGLRRYNERALTEEVRLLLQEWKGMIDTSELLFIRASGTTNRRTLFGPYDEQVLRQNDARIRGFPFNTRRATQSELMRSFVELTRVKVLEVDEAAIAAAKLAAEEAIKRAAAAKVTKVPTPAPPKRSEEEETALLHTTQIQALVKRSKIPALLTYLKANALSPDLLFYPADSHPHHHAPTALHLAASQNAAPLVYELLATAGANPALRNGDGHTAFDLAGDRWTRDLFRVARHDLGDGRWDWGAAHVPAGLTRAGAEAREARAREEGAAREEARRTAEEVRLREEGPKATEGKLGRAAGRGRALALGMVQKNAQEKREEEARRMTPEMRVRLERERRARAAEERMKRSAGN